MDFNTSLMLLAAGLGGGVMSSLAGGASLLMFPAMLAAGVPPVMAAASNSVGSMPGSLIAALTDRSQLPKLDRSFITLIVVALAFALGGAVLLMVTPERVFELLVPLLLGFGTLLIAYAKPLGQRLGRISFGRNKTTLHPNAIGLALMVPVSIYGGYFGAGVGVMMIAALSVANGGNYRAANVTKNFLVGLQSVITGIVFIGFGMVAWTPTLLVGSSFIFGSICGAYVARILPPRVAHIVVVGFGALLTAVYAWRYWF